MARKVGVTHEQLVTVAGQLADANGLDQLTLTQVAESLRIRLPSVYNHVSGLTGLRRDLAMLGGQQILARINREAIGKSVDEAVMDVSKAFRTYATEHPGLYQAAEHAPAEGDKEAQQLAGEIVGVVLAVLRPLKLGETEAIHAVRGLRSIIHGFVMLERDGGFGMPVDHEESYEFLVKTYLVGLHQGCEFRGN